MLVIRNGVGLMMGGAMGLVVGVVELLMAIYFFDNINLSS